MRRRIQLIILSLMVVWALAAQPGSAQTVRLETAVQQFYTRLPDFPKENQYRNVQGNKPDLDNTIVHRLIRYHLYVKGRPQTLRLDWKHTIADFLDANETIDPKSYPTQERLKNNPLEGDRAVISKLTRQQREQLIQALVGALGGKSQ